MKFFAITKIGYTSGIYGCSGEQFLAIWTSKEGLKSYAFEGLYGAGERVSRLFLDKKYKTNYIGNRYGQMTRQEAKYFKSEYIALKELKELI